MATPLSVLWDASSVAVVGASERPGALGRLPVAYLQRYGYRGRILPVNPRADTVLGLPVHPTVQAARDATGPVDLALLLVAADRVLDAVDDCVAAEVPVAVVMSSGFAETGEAGARRQRELVERAHRGGMRVVGPNCIGTVGFANGQVTTFTPLFGADDVPMAAGSIGFVSQSGALGYGAVSLALERGLRLGWAVNTGNEADVDAVEVLAALADEPGCTALLGYVESLADGTALRALASRGTAIALVKAGRSDAGARAAASHTGALATSDRVVDDVLRQLHIARAADVDDLLDIGDAFAQPRRPGGSRVAVVTTSGGSGILATDELAATGLVPARFGPETQAALDAVVPDFGSTANPVDVTATVMSDPELFGRCLDAIADDEGVDAIVACFCVLTGADVDRVVASLGAVAQRSDLPVVVARTGAEFLAPKAADALRAAGIPAYPTPARAVRALAALWHTRPRPAAERRRGPTLPPPPRDATEVELKTLLGSGGIPVPRGRLCHDADDARVAVLEVGGTAVLKAVVRGLLHKTEVGGVLVGVRADDAPRAYGQLRALGGDVLVEQYVPQGAEVLVGVAPTSLGPVLTLASGGVLAEVLDDAVFRLLPIDADEARDMVAALRGVAVLRGARGRPPLDVAALEALLLAVSDAVDGWPVGYELDLNPVLVQEQGVCVLDAAYVPPPAEATR